MFRGTLEIEFGLKAIDPVSLRGLSVKLDAPLSLYKVISHQSGSNFLQELVALPAGGAACKKRDCSGTLAGMHADCDPKLRYPPLPSLGLVSSWILAVSLTSDFP